MGENERTVSIILKTKIKRNSVIQRTMSILKIRIILKTKIKMNYVAQKIGTDKIKQYYNTRNQTKEYIHITLTNQKISSKIVFVVRNHQKKLSNLQNSEK